MKMKKAIISSVAVAALLTGCLTSISPKAEAGVVDTAQNLIEKGKNALTTVIQKFKDVPATHWAYSSVMDAVNSGFFKGYSDGTFKPTSAITKAEMATILGRLNDQPKAYPDRVASFSDTPSWAKEDLTAAVQKGFIDPAKYNGKLNANAPLTRGELATWLAQGLASANPEYKAALSDVTNTVVPAKEYFTGKMPSSQKNSIAVAMGTGLMSVASDKTFGLDRTTTRAEAATLISRYIQVAKKQPSDYKGLEELREVGLTGTNIKIIAPSYQGLTKEDIVNAGWNSNKVTDDFSIIRDQELATKTGYADVKIKNWIIVNPYVKAEDRSIFYPVFVDENQTPLYGAYYSFAEVSLNMRKSIGMTTAGNLINSPTFDLSGSPKSKAFVSYSGLSMYSQLTGFPPTFSTLNPTYWTYGKLHFDKSLDTSVFLTTKTGIKYFLKDTTKK